MSYIHGGLATQGLILGQEGGRLLAVCYLRRSYDRSPGPADRDPPSPSPLDPATSCRRKKHFPAVLEIEAPEELRGLARNGLREIAARDLKARGAEEGRRSFIRLVTAALSQQVAGGGPGDRL